MQRTVIRIGAVSTAILLGLSLGVAAAQSTATTTETKRFTVIAVDGNQLVVRLPEGTREITVPDDFRFLVNGQSMSVHELKPGMSGTATITTTTTVKPVTVTEVRNGTVDKVMGSTVVIRTAQGFRMITEGDLTARNIKIVKDGQPVNFSGLHAGDRLTATIITEKPPQILTEKQVEATLAANNPGGAAAAAGAAAKTAASATSGAASGTANSMGAAAAKSAAATSSASRSA